MNNKIICVIFLTLTFSKAFAQLGMSKSDIFSINGSEYDSKIDHTTFTIYSFVSKIQNTQGEMCDELLSYFINNESEMCFQVTYTSCANAANVYVKILNDIAVKIDSNKWKDYQNNSVYTLHVEGNIVNIEHFFDY